MGGKLPPRRIRTVFIFDSEGNDKYGKPVAVLVDEYDTPLQHTLYDKDEHEEVCDIYRSFFPALKTGGKYEMPVYNRYYQIHPVESVQHAQQYFHYWLLPEYSTVCGITTRGNDFQFQA